MVDFVKVVLAIVAIFAVGNAAHFSERLAAVIAVKE
jgi:hypothetical protein